jgi:hypothetical protein
MRRLALSLSITFLCSVCFAQTPQITRADITEFGEYTLDVQKTDWTSANGIPQRTVGNVKLSQQTRVIHLHKDLHFGFRYTLVGSPEQSSVTVRMVMLYPPPGLLRPGESTTILRDESSRDRTIGLDYYRGYTIADDWMMVPGDWTFQIWYGDQLLTSQTFTLVQ